MISGHFAQLMYSRKHTASLAGVCAGIPNSGKSEFIDALALSLALNHYWPIAFCSLEKTVVNHFKDLAEKVWGRPFLKDAKNATSKERMSADEVLPFFFASDTASCHEQVSSVVSDRHRLERSGMTYGFSHDPAFQCEAHNHLLCALHMRRAICRFACRSTCLKACSARSAASRTPCRASTTFWSVHKTRSSAMASGGW
jgi:hypothetical protein